LGHSWVEFGGRSVPMRDAEIVTVVKVVADLARRAAGWPEPTDNVTALLHAWDTLIDEAYAPGGIDVGLDRFVQTEADRACLLGLLDRARGTLRDFGAAVPADYLNRVVDAPGVLTFGDWPTTDLLGKVDTFARVLAGD